MLVRLGFLDDGCFVLHPYVKTWTELNLRRHHASKYFDYARGHLSTYLRATFAEFDAGHFMLVGPSSECLVWSKSAAIYALATTDSLLYLKMETTVCRHVPILNFAKWLGQTNLALPFAKHEKLAIFMRVTQVTDDDMALRYLKWSNGDIDNAVTRYVSDASQIYNP